METNLHKHGQLTPAELDVLMLAASGKRNRDIAKWLGIAEGTVENHLHSIFCKLRVRNRTAAAIKAVKMGLVQL